MMPRQIKKAGQCTQSHTAQCGVFTEPERTTNNEGNCWAEWTQQYRYMPHAERMMGWWRGVIALRCFEMQLEMSTTKTKTITVSSKRASNLH